MKTRLPIDKTFIALVVLFSISFQLFAQTATVAPKIEVKDIAVQKAMTIKMTAPSNAIGQKMGELYGKLFGYLGANSIKSTGAPFAVYYTYDPNGNTEFEVGIPVAATVQGNDEIKFREYPAMKVISTLHVGPYENLGPVYEALKKYATYNKLETQSVSWEVYLTDPSQETDTSKYQTLIYFVIK